jgi:hypothetical protein
MTDERKAAFDFLIAKETIFEQDILQLQMVSTNSLVYHLV